MNRFQVLWERLLRQCSLANGFLSDDAFNEAMAGLESRHRIESTGFETTSKTVLVHGPNGLIVRARTPNQQRMVDAMERCDLLFALGPAGSGKTYTAVALAVRSLKNKEVRKIILTRPAVEAGERLGFLPGDLTQKVDPYLRPLYDALYDLMGFEQVHKAFERQALEIAPLVFMRGRTLNHAFIILDEAQNTTREQMKMFLTRIGFGSKAVITGDVTQIDLPRNKLSGLVEAVSALRDVQGIGMHFFSEKDVVRHPLVQSIVLAYKDHRGSRESRI